MLFAIESNQSEIIPPPQTSKGFYGEISLEDVQDTEYGMNNKEREQSIKQFSETISQLLKSELKVLD